MTPDISAYSVYIRAALEHSGGTHTFEDVAAAVADGRMQFWPGVSSVIVTEILDHPQKRLVNFFLAGGNLTELEGMEPGVCEWAREQGCTGAIFGGRKGWERSFLTRTGWTPRLVVFEKAL